MGKDDPGRRKLADDALPEDRDFISAVLDTVGALVVVFLDCNPAAARLFGYSREELIGKTPYDVSFTNQPDGRSSKEKALEILAAVADVPMVFEWQHRRVDGKHLQVPYKFSDPDLRREIVGFFRRYLAGVD